MTPKILKRISLTLSILLYLPFWSRIIERGTSGDISLVFQGILLAMQLCNLKIAFIEGAKFFKLWYTLQAILVTVSILIVGYYYD